MRRLVLFGSLIVGLLFVSSCKTVHTNKNGIPPGHAKKITGSQSAKPYAPGQNK
ncbi:hypothetical protein [Dysgonomonas sp. HGC4]|uniref:hypothetical protein n=1 Tax=Dysgonomonas sp. HGC4 TaxID=1658009 RepID=UPI000AD1C3F1|nr:hypothetical protein [Dysgonomonas sp. HGC4]MBD8349388.1 hypothetical protein [Dysgonomonas sp. HGC4]